MVQRSCSQGGGMGGRPSAADGAALASNGAAEPHRVARGDQRRQEPARAADKACPGTTGLGWVPHGTGWAGRRNGPRDSSGRGTWTPGPKGKVPFPIMTCSIWSCTSHTASNSNESAPGCQRTERKREGLRRCLHRVILRSGQTNFRPDNSPEV